MRLRAVVPNPDQVLLPGMYVRAVLAMAVDEQAILVPQQAVTRNAKGEAQALVVDAAGKVEQRALRTGDAIGDRWVVHDGLSVGDRVIVEGGARVRPGMEVRTADVAAEAANAPAPSTTDAPAPATPSPEAAAAAPGADAAAD